MEYVDALPDCDRAPGYGVNQKVLAEFLASGRGVARVSREGMVPRILHDSLSQSAKREQLPVQVCMRAGQVYLVRLEPEP